MKKFLLLVFVLGTLKEAMSLDVSTHPDLKELLEDGYYHIHHASTPTITPAKTKGEYNATVAVELRQGATLEEVLGDYVSQLSPLIIDFLKPRSHTEKIESVPVVENSDQSEPVQSEADEEEKKQKPRIVKLRDMTVAELRELAKNKGIDKISSLNKSELLEAIVTPAEKKTKKKTRAQIKRERRANKK